jgi:hypothetical protein
MASGKFNFVIEQGTTLNFEIAYTDSGSNKIDLTGYRGRMQIRDKFPGPSKNGSRLILSLSSSLDADGTGLNFSGSSGTNSPTEGTIGVFISDTNTAAMDFSKAVYDLEIVSASIVTRLLEGKVTLNPEVTIIP